RRQRLEPCVLDHAGAVHVPIGDDTDTPAVERTRIGPSDQAAVLRGAEPQAGRMQDATHLRVGLEGGTVAHAEPGRGAETQHHRLEVAQRGERCERAPSRGFRAAERSRTYRAQRASVNEMPEVLAVAEGPTAAGTPTTRRQNPGP